MPTIKPFDLSLIEEAYKIEQQSHLFPWPKNIFESNFGLRYANFVIFKQNNLAGFCICQTVVDEATLFNIAISPEMQRKGLGELLLSHLINELETVGIKTLWLEVRKSNKNAIKLYEKMGFATVTQRVDYYPTHNGREDALVMAFSISF
ncbi:ribosomal protein S18-alanine N-acetyltransferase [Thorsellia kenyensis]|uniref:[Ribosomal protein bS18]-alanine N-acetyltransferase n=1 Tax=Thorsellia kenyensis TaxID=1549888 RepID=A0ABV6CB23_9GAMM